MKKYYGIFTALFFFAVFFSFNVKTEAAWQQNLKPDITYTRQLTGKANHKIRFTQVKSGRYYKDLKIMIDKKVVRTFSGKKDEVMSYNVYLLNVDTNRTLISVCAHADSDLMPYMNLYEYKNKKLNFIANFASLTRASNYEKANRVLTPWARCKVKAVVKNKIFLAWTDQTPATGNISMNIAYTISGNTVKKVGFSSELRMSSTNQNHPKWTANRAMKGKSNLLSNNYDFSVKAGQKVTLFAMTVQNGKRYMLLTDATGKKGWVLVPFFHDEDPLKKVDKKGNIIWGYFKECKFIG